LEETGLPRENHDPPQVTDKVYHIMLVVIDTDCIGSYKSNYHMITTLTDPQLVLSHLPCY
jgi:hypothetical protein